MFSSIWVKITAALSAFIAILLTILKFKSDKIERLEEKAEVNEKLDEIRKEEKKAIKEIKADEVKRIKKKLKIKPNHTRRERIKRMRDNQNSA